MEKGDDNGESTHLTLFQMIMGEALTLFQKLGPAVRTMEDNLRVY